MARPKKRAPDLVHHKPTNQGRVRIDGKDFYMGPGGTPECEEAYRHLIAELLANGPLAISQSRKNGAPASPTVNEIVLAYWKHADAYYRKAGEHR